MLRCLRFAGQGRNTGWESNQPRLVLTFQESVLMNTGSLVVRPSNHPPSRKGRGMVRWVENEATSVRENGVFGKQGLDAISERLKRFGRPPHLISFHYHAPPVHHAPGSGRRVLHLCPPGVAGGAPLPGRESPTRKQASHQPLRLLRDCFRRHPGDLTCRAGCFGVLMPHRMRTHSVPLVPLLIA